MDKKNVMLFYPQPPFCLEEKSLLDKRKRNKIGENEHEWNQNSE